MKATVKSLGVTALLTLFAGSGCSSGSGAESDTTTASNPGSPGNATQLTMSGFVTDDPIVNAGVVFKVGNREFGGSVPTGSQGEFQINIESEDPNALVTSSAYDAANGVRLTAVLDTFAGCQDLATDNVVTSVKITNITTALQVLAERLALDGTIDDYDEFLSLLPQIDATELLELSSAIKVVVENINGVVLPSGLGDTLELARAIADGTSSFEADLELLSPGALMMAQNKLLTDGHATQKFAAANASGVYAAVDNSFIYAVFANGTALVEYFDDRPMVTTPSWTLTDSGKLQINYYGFAREFDSLTLLGETSRSMHLVADLDNPASAGFNRRAAAVSKFAFGTAFDQNTIAGVYADPRNSQDTLILETGGAGTLTRTGVQASTSAFTWAVNSSGNLDITFSDSNQRLEIINLNASGQSKVLAVTRFGSVSTFLAVGALTVR